MTCSFCGNSRLIRIDNQLVCVSCRKRYTLRNVIRLGVTKAEEEQRVIDVSTLLMFH